jgi:hypothetical protein
MCNIHNFLSRGKNFTKSQSLMLEKVCLAVATWLVFLRVCVHVLLLYELFFLHMLSRVARQRAVEL